MQIRQLEALQAMAKTASSKVVFVPMQLQSDVVGQLANQAGSSSGAGVNGKDEFSDGISRAGVLSSIADV